MPIDIDQYKKILVVSPHLDDGVLSVGGIIEKAVAKGTDVVVATAFTADAPPPEDVSSLATDLHALWNIGPNPFEQRRREDVASVAILGARILHGHLPDAIYRTGPAGDFLYSTRQSISQPPSEQDGIGNVLSQLLDNWIGEISPDLVLSPLGVGRHVDHVLTTNALHRVAKARPVNVALYEDMPYSTGLFPVANPDSVEAALGRTSWRVAGPRVVPVEISKKLDAVAAYGSQLADIFPNGLHFGSVLEDYMRNCGNGTFAERIWETAK
ncbi:MAG: PIG-L deacetylase family protein [Rhizobiaceae bacterium]